MKTETFFSYLMYELFKVMCLSDNKKKPKSLLSKLKKSLEL